MWSPPRLTGDVMNCTIFIININTNSPFYQLARRVEAAAAEVAAVEVGVGAVAESEEAAVAALC